MPWTFTEELQVATLTKLHDLLRVTHAAVPRRRGSHYRPIPPLRIPRPGENTKPKAIRPAAFFRMMTTGGD